MSGLVSVIIPCRNEVKHIEKTIRAILSSYYPNLEVIVVDGMSTDGTRKVLTDLTKEEPRVKMIDNPKRLTPYAFNIGVNHSAGEYIQIVGSRNVMAIDYLSTLVEALKSRTDVACVGGDYQHVYDTENGKVICRAMESKFGVGAGNYRTMKANAYVDTVGVPMYRRTIFKDVGMFDERLTRNQDDEFNYRVRKKGFKILYVHKAKVTYLVRGDFKKAFWQFFQYGYFKVFVNVKHKTMTTIRQMAPAAFIAFWVILFPLSFVLPKISPILGLAFICYILAGMVLAGKNLTLFERMQVLVACFILHIAYGAGYWVGFYDFVVMPRQPRAEFQRQTL